MFKKMLHEYLMIDDMKEAQAWIKARGKGPSTTALFLDRCERAFAGQKIFHDYHRAQDYADSLRRHYYVGMGID